MSTFRTVAIDAARRAGTLLRAELGGVRSIQHKGVINIVTEMDQRAEALIVDAIRTAFPDHAILAEEGGATPGTSPYRWHIDPLDGTTNYAHGIPLYAVSVGLERTGMVELGVVYDPSHEELFVAERARGATLNGEPIRVSACDRLDQSLLVTGFPYDIRTTADTNLPEYAALSLRTLAVRRFGSAALDLAYVAAGRLEAFWELTLGPWDMAAGGLLVQEAGGQVTDVRGGPWRLDGPGVLASNGHLHADVLAALAAAQRGSE